MPYGGGENPKVGDTVKHRSGEVGTVFELDLRADKNEKIRVKFDVALLQQFSPVNSVW
jgi:hypothetical protein